MLLNDSIVTNKKAWKQAPQNKTNEQQGLFSKHLSVWFRKDFLTLKTDLHLFLNDSMVTKKKAQKQAPEKTTEINSRVILRASLSLVQETKLRKHSY